MDLGFSRRRKANDAQLDLASLIACASARQAASPTAVAQRWLGSEQQAWRNDNPRIAIFACDAPFLQFRHPCAGFAQLDAAIFIARQPM